MRWLLRALIPRPQGKEIDPRLFLTAAESSDDPYGINNQEGQNPCEAYAAGV